MNRRYETASTVLTSNKGFEEWGEILGDDVMAAALIDRVLHGHLVYPRQQLPDARARGAVSGTAVRRRKLRRKCPAEWQGEAKSRNGS
jgi:hypothetical protein